MGKAVQKAVGKTGQKKGEIKGVKYAPDGKPYTYVKLITSEVSPKGGISFKSKMVEIWAETQYLAYGK
ncbi:hypothetical protein IT568_11385 [bacterium]|nr:hypothetical protein [bacterium]